MWRGQDVPHEASHTCQVVMRSSLRERSLDESKLGRRGVVKARITVIKRSALARFRAVTMSHNEDVLRDGKRQTGLNRSISAEMNPLPDG